MTKISASINLVILFIAIILIFVIKYQYDEHFIDSNGDIGPLGIQLIPPTLNWYPSNSNNEQINVGGPVNQLPPFRNPWSPEEASELGEHPLIYPAQLYPLPPYVKDLGLSCDNGVNNCSAAGTCINGICERNPSPNTVFDIPV